MKVIQVWICLGSLFVTLSAQALCVKSSQANLRLGPGTKYVKTWEVYKYMPFRQIQKKGSWIKVKDVDGDQHWIHSKLTTKSFRCAVVKVSKANLRTGPGTKYPKTSGVFSVEKYTAFRVLKIKGKWVQLKDEYNDVVWISRKLLWIQ